MRALRPLLVLPLCIFLLTGCDRMNRVRDCRRLSTLVNGALDGIETKTKGRSAKDYRAAAESYRALSKDIRAGREWPGAGKALVDEYASLLDAIVPAVSSYANALDVKDTRSLDEARRTLDRLSKQQHTLVSRIDSYCQAP